MASSRPWPFHDDEVRPSGSVRPLSHADLQAILAHLTSDPDELLAGTSADRPVVAMRVRASVGRPGGAAQARWRRMRAAELAAWVRTLPWRVAVILGIGAGGGALGSLLAPRLGLLVGALAAAAAGWGLRFRPSPGAVAWRRGSAKAPAAGQRASPRRSGRRGRVPVGRPWRSPPKVDDDRTGFTIRVMTGPATSQYGLKVSAMAQIRTPRRGP